MEFPKFALKSKTILGIILTALPTLAPALGIGLEDQALISSGIDAIITVLGASLGAYGRFVAKEPITIKAKKQV